MTIDEYHLYGELFRRLVQTTDGGHIHILILKGFLLALQTTTPVRLTIIQEDDKAALLQERCDYALRPKSNGYPDPSSSRWAVILLMNKTTCNDFFDAALCFDLSARVFYYLYFDFTTQETIQEHVVLEERLCARYDVPLSSKRARKGVNVSEADSGIWLCLAMHLCIEGFDMPAWEPSMRLEARLHVAACILQRRCPSSRDLIIMSTPTHVSRADLVDRTTPKRTNSGEIAPHTTCFIPDMCIILVRITNCIRQYLVD
jgi:hypothetical protein